MDGHDVGVVSETAHGLSLAADSRQNVCIEPPGLDDSEGHVAIEAGVAG